jgi:predicted RNA methylase
VQNIDREDQDRYSTVASIQKTKRFWRNEEGQVVNPYQKPVLLLRKLLVMAQRTTNGLVVDITCGTGTTAVGSLLLPFPG